MSQGNATDGKDFLLDGFTLQMIAGALMGMAWCSFGVGSPIYRVAAIKIKPAHVASLVSQVPLYLPPIGQFLECLDVAN